MVREGGEESGQKTYSLSEDLPFIVQGEFKKEQEEKWCEKAVKNLVKKLITLLKPTLYCSG